MAGRAIWKGSIEIGDESIPVKLFSAVEDKGVRFRLLHGDDEVPVSQRMVSGSSGEPVDKEAVHRGYEVEKGVFVMLSPDELAELEPAPSRSIEIVRFVPADAIDPAWYDKPYYLGPEKSAADYFALVAALRDAGREGIARWVMRKKRYVGALRVHGDHLMLHTMRFADQVVEASALDVAAPKSATDKELKMAEQLVASMEDEFDPDESRDEFRERVRALAEAKAEGEELELPRQRRPRPTASLTDALRRSLEAREAHVG